MATVSEIAAGNRIEELLTASGYVPSGGVPGAHAASHQNGGSDEIGVAGLSGVLADPQPPIIGAGAAQAVAGNDARLADARTPLAHVHAAADVTSGVFAMARLATGVPDGTKFIRDDGTLAAAGGGGAHAASHQNGGADEISVAGLSGLLADAQTPLAHTHAPADITGTAVVDADARLSDARTPLAHKASHENGGADEISVAGLSGLLADSQTPLAHAPALINPGANTEVLTTVAGVAAWAAAPSGSLTTGSGDVDFGSGAFDASVVVADAAVGAGSKIDAFLTPPASDAPRMRDEYWVEDLTVRAGNINPGVGFTLFAKCNFGKALGLFTVNYAF